MNRCGFGPCGGVRLVGGGGVNWLTVLDSIALWILAVAAVLFLLGLRRRSRHWGRNGGRGGAGYGPGRATGWNQTGPTGPAQHPQAEANLAERFSRGEITAEEYRTGIEVLRGQSHGQAQTQAYGQYPAQPFGGGTANPRPTEPGQPEPPAEPVDPTV
jgi:uncharacterized membrane protein